ncbi:MAG TPA: mucin desulfatase [Clostridiales bacterium]|nr:mucin desulfatase [Clostridiales bacterium]
MDEKLLKVLDNFRIEGNVKDVCRYGEGHINITYLVTTDKKRYILQRINDTVFPDTDGLMKNICGVTDHLKKRGIETLNVIKTKDGKSYLKGDEPYRVYDFIENTVVYQTADDIEMFANSGAAFGEFQNYLADYDASTLVEIIPRFHDTPKRFADFKASLKADVLGRAAECKREIDYVLSMENTYSTAVEDLKSGNLPLRVTHNDTKLNNVLIDATTKKARAVIDLDTVMPGSTLYDFGDSIRFGASTAGEAEEDLDKVHFDIGKFKAYAEGYCSAVRTTMTKRERELLAYGSYLMTIECGMRFLADYLAGVVYFRVEKKGDKKNLIRSRTQIKLASEIYARFDDCGKIIKNIFEG